MLVIERGWNESFTVHTPQGDVVVKVAGLREGRVLLGINAPKEWAIERDDMKKTPGGATAKPANAGTPPSRLRNAS